MARGAHQVKYSTLGVDYCYPYFEEPLLLLRHYTKGGVVALNVSGAIY